MSDILAKCEERVCEAISAQRYDLIGPLIATYCDGVISQLEHLDSGARDSYLDRVLRNLGRIRLLLLIDNAAVRDSLNQLPRLPDYLAAEPEFCIPDQLSDR